MTEVFEECADGGSGYLQVDQYLTTRKYKWKILAKVGDGGYGSVYKVDNGEGIEAALKLERKVGRRKRYKLEMEAQVLRDVHLFLKDINPTPEEHFTLLLDKAKKDHFGFIVMDLVGESLADLRKSRRPPCFSLGTAYSLAIKTLEPIRILHLAGYLHRDIKPANYAIGKGEKRRRLVYILDFGIARKYLKSPNSMKTPREKVGFKGTVRYAPLACHEQKELGPKDDVESWLYMCVDLGNAEGCNWRGIKNQQQVYQSKKDARTVEGRKRLFQGIDEREFGLILDYVDRLLIVDRIDYEYPAKLIARAAKTAQVDLNGVFDWEEKGPEKKISGGKKSITQPTPEEPPEKPLPRSKISRIGQVMVSKEKLNTAAEGKKTIMSVYVAGIPNTGNVTAHRKTSTAEKCTRTKSIDTTII